MPRNSEPTSSERTQAIIDDARRILAEREQLLAPYERLQTNGVVLVDGNHCYLEALKAFQSFNESCEKHGGFGVRGLEEIQNLYQEIKGVHIAEYVVLAHSRLTTVLGSWVARDLVDADKEVVDEMFIRETYKPDPNKIIVLNTEIETFVFDARLPPVSEAIKQLEREWNAAKRWGQDKKLESIESWLDLLKTGMWRTYHESEYLGVRYALKDEFLDALTQSEFTDEELADSNLYLDVPLNPGGKLQTVYGKKYINVNHRGQVIQREKAVDTLLVIKGCEIAERPDIDFVCIVTNDGDYEPLIEHIQSKGKDVYLYSAGNPKRISKPLIGAVGWNNCITLKELVSNFDPSADNTSWSKYDGFWKDAGNNPAFLMIGPTLLGKHMSEAFKRQRGNE